MREVKKVGVVAKLVSVCRCAKRERERELELENLNTQG